MPISKPRRRILATPPLLKKGRGKTPEAVKTPLRGKDKWFCEISVPGKRAGAVKHCFLIENLVFKGRSPWQKFLIFDNPLYGRIFVLDEFVQLSEKDESIYHEMIVHPILFSHPNPQNVLVIGGGDGGVLKEVLKHPINKIDLVELDEKVIDISKKYLPFLGAKKSFSNEKVRIFIEKGEEFIKGCKKNLYDIIIIDCTNTSKDSFSNVLYSTGFYKKIFNLLTSEGIMITLGASFLDFQEIISSILKRILSVFPNVNLFKFTMPSYHCGEYCFFAASKRKNLAKIDFREIKARIKLGRYKFKYYSPEIHQASMILPEIRKIR